MDIAADTRILIDGRPAETVSVHDRGLHYGDGLFETIAVIDGQAQLWDRHLDRLERGCRRLGIEPVAGAVLTEEAAQVCAGHRLATLKLLVTRGAGGRGYRPSSAGKRTRRIFLCQSHAGFPPAAYREGVSLRLCTTRLGSNPGLAGIKHLNRLEQVMARREWDDPGLHEGLMRDTDGNVVEGTMTNLFVVVEGRLVTPGVSRCGVAGVMRAYIIELARRHGMAAAEETVSLETLNGADEVFVCNSLIGIWPVRRVGASTYGIGPTTRALMEEVRGVCLMPHAPAPGPLLA